MKRKNVLSNKHILAVDRRVSETMTQTADQLRYMV
jgi:hypothetical protein